MRFYKSKFLSLACERLFFSISFASFLGFVLLRYIDTQWSIDLLTLATMYTLLSLGMLAHYIFILIKIISSPLRLTQKIIRFMGVLILGHFAAWAYTVIISPKNLVVTDSTPPKKRRGITDKIIHAKIFKPITSRFQALSKNS